MEVLSEMRCRGRGFAASALQLFLTGERWSGARKEELFYYMQIPNKCKHFSELFLIIR